MVSTRPLLQLEPPAALASTEPLDQLPSSIPPENQNTVLRLKSTIVAALAGVRC